MHKLCTICTNHIVYLGGVWSSRLPDTPWLDTRWTEPWVSGIPWSSPLRTGQTVPLVYTGACPYICLSPGFDEVHDSLGSCVHQAVYTMALAHNTLSTGLTSSCNSTPVSRGHTGNDKRLSLWLNPYLPRCFVLQLLMVKYLSSYGWGVWDKLTLNV